VLLPAYMVLLRIQLEKVQLRLGEERAPYPTRQPAIPGNRPPGFSSGNTSFELGCLHDILYICIRVIFNYHIDNKFAIQSEILEILEKPPNFVTCHNPPPTFHHVRGVFTTRPIIKICSEFIFKKVLLMVNIIRSDE
jgi:hypothetical protein